MLSTFRDDTMTDVRAAAVLAQSLHVPLLLVRLVALDQRA
jgi:hypothetical protein